MRAFALSASLLALALTGGAAAQDMSKFTDGPVITGFGRVVPVQSDLPIPANFSFKVLLDGAMPAKSGEASRTLDNAARFLNMHVAAGVPERNIHVAVIVYGPASIDLANDTLYAARHEGKPNGNTGLVRQLVAHGVEIYQCGQSATAFGISKADLLPGVKLSLSAMTARALLQQRGYQVVQ